MQKIALVVDSLADLPPDVIAEHNIHTIPIRIRFGTDEYTDRVDLDTARFYLKLAAGGEFPKTSQPPPGDFIKLYESLLDEYDHILSLHISSQLSGTYSTAVSAAERVSPSRITVVDTKSGGLAEGIIAVRAAELIEQGKSLEEVLSDIQTLVANRRIYIVFKSLDYIVKGGRLNAKVGSLLTKLKLMPLITYKPDGSLGRAGIVKNNDQTIPKLIDRVIRELGDRSPTEIGVMHAAALREGKELQTALETAFPTARHMMTEIGPGIGSYAGPGTLAIVYFTQ
ncbi:MAG: DegV family protein [Candidatus Marinimicrobia bacterium]|nr:DegV family protein [Candidatus Neomarinimicrobiota bacterium]